MGKFSITFHSSYAINFNVSILPLKFKATGIRCIDRFAVMHM